MGWGDTIAAVRVVIRPITAAVVSLTGLAKRPGFHGVNPALFLLEENAEAIGGGASTGRIRGESSE